MKAPSKKKKIALGSGILVALSTVATLIVKSRKNS